jgi:hypothetical protein
MVDPKKEYKVPDMQPAGFVIEFLDEEQKPIAGIKFNVAVDEGNETSIETDENGLIKVPKPKGEIKLSLAEEGFMEPDMEEEKADTTLQGQESTPLMTEAEYRAEGQISKQTCKDPYKPKVRFADIPPEGYWPVITSKKEGREVSYINSDGKPIGHAGSRGAQFLAWRPAKGQWH